MPFKPGQSGNPKGRTPKAQKFERQINRAEKKIADRLPELIDAQFDLALGVTVQEVDRETGELVVHTRPPDGKAGQYLIDRILGKPTQRMEHDIGDVTQLSDEELEAIATGKSSR